VADLWWYRNNSAFLHEPLIGVGVKDPVSCALMSDLLRGVRRWPSWVFAYVSGTNLFGVLGAHNANRYCLNC
jgi:hypothetical protein